MRDPDLNMCADETQWAYWYGPRWQDLITFVLAWPIKVKCNELFVLLLLPLTHLLDKPACLIIWLLFGFAPDSICQTQPKYLQIVRQQCYLTHPPPPPPPPVFSTSATPLLSSAAGEEAPSANEGEISLLMFPLPFRQKAYHHHCPYCGWEDWFVLLLEQAIKCRDMLAPQGALYVIMC